MTASATAAPDAGPHPGGRSAVRGALAGTGTLIRFNLRRDRVRLPVWLAALVAVTVASTVSLADLYPTAASRQAIAETTDSPAGLALSGPRHYLVDYTYGAMLSHQMIGFAAVLVALMSVFVVTRHTRTEEETGRAELVRSAVVGRHAYLTAALAVAALANLALALLLTVGLGGLGVESVTWSGSLLYGAVHFGIGMVFAGFAAVAVQLTAYSRAASGMALAAAGTAYVLRAAGDVGSDTLAWLSPIGWAQRAYPYAGDRWWPVLLLLALATLAAGLAYGLSVRRDLDAGLWAARPGRPTATRSLTRPLGLALRLHRGMLLGFAVGLLLIGVSYGSLLGDVEEMLDGITAMEEALEELGGASVVESFAAMMLTLMSVVASVHVVLAVLRARGEETAGRVEPLLATALSRSRWLGGHLTVALLGGPLLLFLAGLGFGGFGALATGDAGLLPRLALASLAHTPALWVAAGVAAALYGLLPRWTALAWAIPVYGFLVGYLGPLLRFPDWMTDLSPFGHVPQVPAEPMNWVPMAVLTAVAGVLLAFGFTGFRRRDLDSK